MPVYIYTYLSDYSFVVRCKRLPKRKERYRPAGKVDRETGKECREKEEDIEKDSNRILDMLCPFPDSILLSFWRTAEDGK